MWEWGVRARVCVGWGCMRASAYGCLSVCWDSASSDETYSAL